MEDWSKGVLPVHYYSQVIRAIGGENLEIDLRQDKQKPGNTVSPEQLPTAEITKDGAAVFDFKLNGVDASIVLLPLDATTFTLDRYNLMALGQPTPYHQWGTKRTVRDPRDSVSFSINGIKHLETGGILDYAKRSFGFIPNTLTPSVLGLEIVADAEGSTIVQKTADYPDRIAGAYKIADKMREATFALSGSNPRLFEYYHAPEQSDVDYLREVLKSYRNKLASIRKFIASLPVDTAEELVDRFEFLMLGPIATNGQLDKEKVQHISEAPDDADEPSAPRHHGPYFGRVDPLIAAHNSDQVNIFEYYQILITLFNNQFSRFRA
jgi:hypothetical protein